MRASWFVARADLRRRWVGVAVLTVLVAVVSAVVLAALAGARRTSSAFERFQDETLAADLTVFIPAIDDATLAQLRRLPGVESIGRGRQLTATVNGESLGVGGPIDASLGRTVARPRVLEGRLPDQYRADEIAVPEPLARGGGIEVGDTIALRGYTQAQVDAVFQGGAFTEPEGPEVPLRVVGITRSPGDLSIEGSGGGLLFTTRQFVHDHGDQIGTFASLVLLVRVTDSEAARAFVQRARALVAPVGQPGEFQVQPPSETEGAVQQSIDVLSAALVAFAAVVALAGMVIVAIALRRFVDGAATDVPALRGLGVARTARVAAIALPLVPVAVGGALLGVLGAWLASPLMPLGIARNAEPSPGLDVDGLVLGAGLLAVFVIVVAVAWFASSAVVRAGIASAARRPQRSTVATATTRAGCAPSVTVGVVMALEPGRGRSAVPVRPAIAGAIVAVLGVVAVGVFSTSLRDLVTTPARYGYDWDTHFKSGAPDAADPDHPCSSVRTALVDDRAVAGAAAMCSNTVEVDGRSVGAYGYVPLSGGVEPVALEGRLPSTTDEVALGSDTLANVGVGIGDRVEIAGPDATRTLRVVGRVVLPKLGDESDVQAVAEGAILTGRGLEALSGPSDFASIDFLVRWRAGADVAAAKARIAHVPGELSAARTAAVPLEVKRLDQLDALPWTLGGVLALIGVLGVGYALVTAVRRRARDLAVLKTLGFRRRQVIATVATQATVFALIGLVVGIPLGVVVGRLVWQQVADGAGLVADATMPALGIIGIAAATVLVVNLIAVIPARKAARTRPATVLRSE